MRKFEIVKDEHLKYDNKDIKMPVRATKHSVGYDFILQLIIHLNQMKQNLFLQT